MEVYAESPVTKGHRQLDRLLVDLDLVTLKLPQRQLLIQAWLSIPRIRWNRLSSWSLHTSIMHLMLVTLVRLMGITIMIWLIRLPITCKDLLLISLVGLLELQLLIFH